MRVPCLGSECVELDSQTAWAGRADEGLLAEYTGTRCCGKRRWCRGSLACCASLAAVGGRVVRRVVLLTNISGEGREGSERNTSGAVLFVSYCVIRAVGELVPGSRVGTSSSRRAAQIKHSYPHLQVWASCGRCGGTCTIYH